MGNGGGDHERQAVQKRIDGMMNDGKIKFRLAHCKYMCRAGIKILNRYFRVTV